MLIFASQDSTDSRDTMYGENTSGPVHGFKTALDSADRPGTYFNSCTAIANDTIFALVILLIELCLHVPFPKLVSSRSNSRWRQTASRVLSEIDDTADRRYVPSGPRFFRVRVCILSSSVWPHRRPCVARLSTIESSRYGDAVRRCVLRYLLQRDTSLADASFRRFVYDGIVTVLQEDVDEFLGRR